MKSLFRSIYPDIIAIIGFIVISYGYFSPVLDGKQLPPHDTQQSIGMSRELVVYNQQTGKDAMWTNSMFSGMPSYQIKGGKLNNIFHSLQTYLRLYLPFYTVGILFIYLIGFYFLLRTLKLSHIIAFAGAVAFAFTSFNFVIIFAGHVTEAYAIGFMAPVVAGVLLTYNRNYIAGGLITLCALGVEISANHYQITYYLALIILIYVIIKFIETIRTKAYKSFIIASVITIFAVGLSIVPNTTSIWTTYEVSKYSTRGKPNLSDKSGDQTTGLSKSYILNDYSYSIPETMTLMIPNFMGGPTTSALSENSNFYSVLKQNGYPDVQARKAIRQLPTYWGDQRYTAGPVYLGAIVCFLFILSLFVIRGPIKWWLVSVTLISILLAWGKNLPFLSNLFIDYFPVYNKFRTVSMILVMASVVIPLGAFLGLKAITEDAGEKAKLTKRLFNAYYIAGGIALFFAILGGAFFSFSSPIDAQMQWPAPFTSALQSDRASLLRMDAFRSFIFITLSAGLIWLYLKDKLNFLYLASGLLLLVLADQWSVDKRYINSDNFISAKQARDQFNPSDIDRQILQDTTYFRVFNLSRDPFNEAMTSYYHKSIGGYHGAKLKRYQELIENQIGKNNIAVLSMLNAKYFIVPVNDKGAIGLRVNSNAMGNAWFVDSVKWVNNADEEMASLSKFNPATTAIFDKSYSPIIGNLNMNFDSSARIRLTHYAPDELRYASQSSKDKLAVFSEIFYPEGWQAKIDGKPAQILRANYTLRALLIPAGSHSIEMKFEPRSYLTGQKISKASSVLIVLLVLAGIAWGVIKSKRKTELNEEPS
jgi:hypothetical protein